MDETLLPQRQVEMRRKNIHKTIVSNGKTKKIAALAKSEREDDVERAEASTMGCDSMASSRASAVELELVVSWLAREREKKSEVEAAITFSTDKTVPKHSDIGCALVHLALAVVCFFRGF